jgi:hypothetical protein
MVTSREPAVDVAAVVNLIAQTQRPDGQIPWSVGGKTDPWDHIEAAMGLSIGARWREARRAFQWLKKMQLEDGSWYAAYQNETVQDHTRETNHAAYIAVGLLHHHRITGDSEFLRSMWPTLEAAVNFTIGLQAQGGEIYWALNREGEPDPMALLTGCSSICFSLKCALAICRSMGMERPRWRLALTRLLDCIRRKPYRFNMTKSRFSMDWFYPILGGALTGAAAEARIAKYWKKFVIQNMGVRCVSDQPWVTIAESSELVLALSAMGNSLLARIVFSWVCDHTFDDGSYWCGFTFPDMVLWPEEKISWTNAVVLMAADALFGLTPASTLFSHRYWDALDRSLFP